MTKWVRHVAGVRETRNTYMRLIENPEGVETTSKT